MSDHMARRDFLRLTAAETDTTPAQTLVAH
jgi:hypothetical protein